MRILFLCLLCFAFSAPAMAVESDHIGLESGIHDEYHDELAAAHGDYKEAEGLPQLNPEWYISQLFWLAVMFIIMHLAFRFKVLPDLSSVIERRREQIENDLTSAENLKDEAERVHAEYDSILASAREKSSALFARVEAKTNEKQMEEYADFQGKANKVIAEAEVEIGKAKNKAIVEMHDVAVEIASLASEKLVGIAPDEKKTKSVIADLGKKKAA